MKPSSPGCTCCNCQDKAYFSDDFSTNKPDWNFTADIFETSLGRLRLKSAPAAPSGSYFRIVPIDRTGNLRITVSAQVFENWAGDATVVGIFIGGIASVHIEKVSGNFRVKFGIGCDAFGNNPTTVYDLIWPNGLGGGDTPRGSLSLTIENDWTNTGHFFIVAGGSYYGNYAAEITVPLGPTLNIGVMGDGMWDNFQIVRNHNANRCRGCGACSDPQKLPKTILLSVPPMDDGSCNCNQLSGDFVLNFKTFANRTQCVFDIACVWRCDAMGGCGDGFDTCGPGFLWQLNLWGGAMQLQATNARDILEYTCPYGTFDCEPGAINTFNYSCTVCGGACVGFPASLLTVNV